LAWRQGSPAPEQYLAPAVATTRSRTQRPGKCLAVHASELVVKPDLQIIRRYRRPLLLRLEHAHRSTLEDHVHRAPRLGERGLLNVRIGIRRSGFINGNINASRTVDFLLMFALMLVLRRNCKIIRGFVVLFRAERAFIND